MATSQILQHLYSLNTSSTDFSRYLYHLIQSDGEDHYLLDLQGSDLIRVVDFLDKALAIIPTADDVSRLCLHKLQAICSHHGILPSSHIIAGGLIRVGDYPVASGGFSDVWEGVHDNTKVCIKCPRITIRDRQDIEKAFYKEAIMWKRLKHQNIVPFIGVMQNPLQFISEWMPNGSLIDYLGKNSGVNRIDLLLDVAEGLAYLHAQHTTHGDLKGPNILVDHDGRARLTDFGFASVVRGLNSVLVSKVQGYTPRWAAPEVIEKGERNTREADVYAFSMVVIEVFTGKCPFSGLTDPVAVSKIMACERPDRPQEQDLTDPVWDMTVWCWQQDPSRRPKVKKVVATLRECHRSFVSAAKLPMDLELPASSNLRHDHVTPTHDTAQTFLTSQEGLVAPSFEDACRRIDEVAESWKQSANLPNPDLLKHLVDVFFAWHPHANRLLHQPTFLFTLSLPQKHPKFPRAALLHAICAVASIFTPAVSNPDLQGTPDDIFATKRRGAEAPSTFAEEQAKFAAEQIDLLNTLGESLVEALQALVVLSWFYWMHARWVEVFTATGRALRGCVPMGIILCPPFHSIQELSRFPSILPNANSVVEDEVRRNTFYFCYLLDRQQGFANGWAMALDDMDITQLLPLRGDQFDQGVLVTAKERQWFHDPHMLLNHPGGQTDSFILMVKASVILSKVKNFNLRYRARYFAKDPDFIPAAPMQLPSSEVMDPRSTPAFTEIDVIVSSFMSSFPPDLRNPINGNVVDVHLFTACTIPYVAMIVLHEPHAALRATGDISATKLLIAARQILTLIYSIWSTSFDLALLDVFICFTWYTCGRILAKFMRAAYEANRPDQVETLKTELQSVRFALGKMGERIPVAHRYYTMLSAIASQSDQENVANFT